MPQTLLWEAEFEIERARFGQAAALIKEAQNNGTADSNSLRLPEKRLARLLFSVGRFADAQKTALDGRRWDGKDAAKLKGAAAMNLVTLGEIAFAKGDIATAISIWDKASAKSRNTSSLDGLEWIRAQAIGPNGKLALALLSGAEIYARTGQVGEATACYASAIPVLERELGRDAPRLEIARRRYSELLESPK